MSMNDEPEALQALRRELREAGDQLREAKMNEANAIAAVDELEGLGNRLMGLFRGDQAQRLQEAEAKARAAIAHRNRCEAAFNTRSAALDPDRVAREAAARLARERIEEVAHLTDDGRQRVVALRQAIAERQTHGKALELGRIALRRLHDFADLLRSGGLTVKDLVVPAGRHGGTRTIPDPAGMMKFEQTLAARTNAEEAAFAFLAAVPGATLRTNFRQSPHIHGKPTALQIAEMGRITSAMITDIEQTVEIVKIEQQIEAEAPELLALQAELQALLRKPT